VIFSWQTVPKGMKEKPIFTQTEGETETEVSEQAMGWRSFLPAFSQ
jgi:hypothetical protein